MRQAKADSNPYAHPIRSKLFRSLFFSSSLNGQTSVCYLPGRTGLPS
ncbi:hypothetical protein C1G86_1527 [Dehalococcoides mccartyi]|uniref:Uncharacterized protein n=1 Tax=Dehalococcoides mccartyi TaxID=61435 RepID=A0A328EMZ8_9CHLR|nr:hypothetical protein C1G86_1527 [Dehalococcoides mccartyi]